MTEQIKPTEPKQSNPPADPPVTPTPDVKGDGKKPAPEKTFTQAELDRIVSERLVRDQAKYSDYDDLKSAADKWGEHEQEQLSELEKAQTAAQAAQQALELAQRQTVDMQIQNAFIAAAAKAGAAHPEDAYHLANRSDIIITDGKVVGVTDAINSLVEANRLVMKGKPAPPDLNGGAGGGDRPTDSTSVKLTEDELFIAKQMGIKPEDYAKYRDVKTLQS